MTESELINKKIDIICYCVGLSLLFFVMFLIGSYMINDMNPSGSFYMPNLAVLAFVFAVLTIIGFFVIWALVDKIKEYYEK